MCYSVDKPVSIEKIKKAIVMNSGVLNARGQEIRKAAAIAVNTNVEQQVAGLTELEMSVTEVEPDNHKVKGDPVDETIVVTRDPNPESAARNRGRRGRR